jgi:hypothetical protein
MKQLNVKRDRAIDSRFTFFIFWPRKRGFTAEIAEKNAEIIATDENQMNTDNSI